MLAFFFFVLSGWGSILSCFCADINTTYSMGTAASCCRFYCCWCCYYTTGRAYAGQIFPVGVDVMLPFLLLLVLLLHYGEGKCCKNFRRWCRRCVAVFTAVGAAITLRRRQMLQKKFFAVGTGVALPFLLLLVLLLHYGEGKCCKNSPLV